MRQSFFTWGDDYLGSERGYINIDYPEKYGPTSSFPPGIAKFFFGYWGGTMYEAEVKQDKNETEENTYTSPMAMMPY